MIKVKRKVCIARREHGRHVVKAAPAAPPDQPASRIPRISRLMALAIHFDRLLRDGKVPDQSELARLAHVTQPRMTQIMNLNHLAPNIQEALLFFARSTSGRDPVHERMLRPIVARADWRAQRRLWAAISRPPALPHSRPAASGT